jgi:8-oxo-dGTP diphosphatase
MSERPSASQSRAPIADLLMACCTVRGGRLVTLVRQGRGGVELPQRGVGRGESLEAAADRLARDVLGRAPAWMAQARADHVTTTSGAPLAVSYAAIVPSNTDAPEGWEWHAAARPRGLAARDANAVAATTALLRDRMDLEPIAFRFLPARFTLSELQGLYELLLGRRLHKASFRRALNGAFLVAPTDEWRSEGRGRPAQLFRYAPRRTGRGHRSVRLELLK